jgi:hypothetical protein
MRLIISTSFLKCFQISPALANFSIIHAQSCLIGRSKTHPWMVLQLWHSIDLCPWMLIGDLYFRYLVELFCSTWGIKFY